MEILEKYGQGLLVLAFCVLGAALGFALGPVGVIAGIAGGFFAAVRAASVIDTPEKLEMTFLSVLSLALLAVLGWLGSYLAAV